MEKKEEKTQTQLKPEEVEAAAPAPEENGLQVYYREKYPDMTFETEAELYGDAADRLRAADERAAKFDEANLTIQEVIDDYPEVGDFISDLTSGIDIRVALQRHFDMDDFAVEADEEIEKDYQAAIAERRNRRKEAEERIATRTANWEESKKLFDEMREWDNEKEEEFGKWLGQSLNDIAMGKITPELMKKLRHGFIFEEAVADAHKEGEIAGRNTEIEAKRIKKAKLGDDMPSPGVGGVSVPESEPERSSLFGDVLSSIEERQRRMK